MEWKQGTPVGRYQILGELDKGSKGIVYSARHTRTHETVALVVLKNPGVTEAYHSAEFEKASSLDHPHIAPVRELWKFEDMIFIISGPPGGRPLEDVFAASPAGAGRSGSPEREPVMEIAGIMRDAALALDHAHRCGVFHEDLRARDIFVGPDGRPLIMGMGWAGYLQRPPRDPGAASPSQVRDELPGGPGKDVRSIGRILHRLITGGHLFEGALGAGASHPGRPRLPEALEETVFKALACDPACRHYSAKALALALDRFLSSFQRHTHTAAVLPEAPADEADHLVGLLSTESSGETRTGSLLSSFWSGVALSVLVLAIFVFVLTASLAVSGLLPETIQKLSLEARTVDFEEAMARSRKIETPRDRIEMLAGLLVGSPGVPGSARARIELGRLYLEQNRWEEALGQMLIALHLRPALVHGRDLLDLAVLLYDHGQTVQSDWLLDRVIDGYQGTEAAWHAIFLKKRMILDRRVLLGIVREIKDLLEGPLRGRTALREEGTRLMKRADSITLEELPRGSDPWVLGDFLSSPGEETAALSAGTLQVSGTGGRTEIPLEEEPCRLWSLDPDGSGNAKILLGYVSGRLEILDPREGVIERTVHLRGRLQGEILCCGDAEGDRLLLVPLTVREKLRLAVISLEEKDIGQGVEYCPLEGAGVVALLAAEWDENSPGEEIVVITDREEGSLITVLEAGTKGGAPSRLYRQSIPGEVSQAVKLGGSRILLGLSTWHVPEGINQNGGKALSGVYLLDGAAGSGRGTGSGIPSPWPLEPVKLLESPTGGRGALILDACAGDFTGRGSLEAVFLVRFPGWLAFEPETRLLLVGMDEEAGCTWLHCPGATAVQAGRLGPGAKENLVLVAPSHLWRVDFKK